jgi:hypothetical protein
MNRFDACTITKFQQPGSGNKSDFKIIAVKWHNHKKAKGGRGGGHTNGAGLHKIQESKGCTSHKREGCRVAQESKRGRGNGEGVVSTGGGLRSSTK